MLTKAANALLRYLAAVGFLALVAPPRIAGDSRFRCLRNRAPGGAHLPETGDRGEPRIVVRPEVDDRAILDPHVPGLQGRSALVRERPGAQNAGSTRDPREADWRRQQASFVPPLKMTTFVNLVDYLDDEHLVAVCRRGLDQRPLR